MDKPPILDHCPVWWVSKFVLSHLCDSSPLLVANLEVFVWHKSGLIMSDRCSKRFPHTATTIQREHVLFLWALCLHSAARSTGWSTKVSKRAGVAGRPSGPVSLGHPSGCSCSWQPWLISLASCFMTPTNEWRSNGSRTVDGGQKKHTRLQTFPMAKFWGQARPETKDYDDPAEMTRLVARVSTKKWQVVETSWRLSHQAMHIWNALAGSMPVESQKATGQELTGLDRLHLKGNT